MTDPTPSPTATKPSALEPEQFAEVAATIEREVGRFIVGQQQLVRQTLISLIAGSHALLEGVPGLGKTMLVRTLAEALDLGFSRIQFTPDLMPADIVGTNVIVEEGGERRFRFQQGPIFGNIVLADEINRATPKTQSALLEAMQEHRVTVAKQQYTLDRAVLRARHAEPARDGGHLPAARGAARPLLLQARRAVPVGGRSSPRSCSARPAPSSRVVGKARDRSRRPGDAAARARRADRPPRAGLRHPRPARDAPRDRGGPEIVRSYVRYGASPRGAQAIVLAAKIRALLDGRFDVGLADVQAVAAPALRHRDHPQLRGRGRGHQHRLRRARDHRRDTHRAGRVVGARSPYIRIYDRPTQAAEPMTVDRARAVLRRGLPAPPRAARARLPAAHRRADEG